MEPPTIRVAGDAAAGSVSGLSTQSTEVKRVVLLDADKPHVRAVSRVLQTAVPPIELRAGLDELGDGDWDLVIFHHDSFDELQRRAVYERFQVQRDRGRMLVLAGSKGRDDIPDILGRFGITNLLACAEEVTPDELFVTLQKVLSGNLFGLEKYLAWGARTQQHKMTKASERHRLLDEVLAFARMLHVPPRLAEAYRLAADELVTNAIFNAPVGPTGEALYASRDRTEEVVLESGQEIVVTLGSDGKNLGLSVSDPFGSLRPRTVVDYLAKCFRKGADQVDEKLGGAGLGFYCVFSALSHFAINIDPGRRTEMVGLIDIRGRFKDFATRPKSFNTFVGASR